MLLPPPETMPSFTVSLSSLHAKFLSCEIQQCLIGIRGHLAKIGCSPVEETEGTASVRRVIGVSSHNRGDGVEGHAQLFGHNLPIRRVNRTLPKVVLPRANQHGVVRVNLDPRAGQRGIE